jgi:hypothetical protein
LALRGTEHQNKQASFANYLSVLEQNRGIGLKEDGTPKLTGQFCKIFVCFRAKRKERVREMDLNSGELGRQSTR